MKLFDYFFYRMYLFQIKKGNPELIGGALFTATVILNLTVAIWLPIIDSLVKPWGMTKYAAIFFYIICVLLSYLRYKSKIGKIIKEYEGSKYNRIIPDWIFAAMVSITAFIGVASLVFLHIMTEL